MTSVRSNGTRLTNLLLLLAVAAVLLALLFAAGGCSRRKHVEVDPLDAYRVDLKDDFQDDIELVRAAPR